jgi:hypothetical protein
LTDNIARHIPDRCHDVVGVDSCPRSSPDVVRQAPGILTAIVAGDFATVEKQFTDDMKAALPPGALAARWAKLLIRQVRTEKIGDGFKNCRV